jgi:FkbM family methyltransferase
MPQIQEPAIVHRFGRYVGTHFRGVKGVDRFLRRIHPPDKRQNNWMETIARAVPNGPNFYLSTRWYGEWTTWFYGSLDEAIYQWIIRNSKPDWVAFDVGMNFGFFACALAQRCEQSHGFEPIGWLADRAQANSVLNQFTNLQVNQIALSNVAGETELFVPPQDDYNWGLSSLLTTRDGSGESLHISTDTLDQYVSRRGLKRLDFIKIDVEGAEHLVLQGALESLNAFHPKIIFEKNPESIKPCIHMLQSIGYKLFDLNGWPLPEDYSRTHDVLAVC